MPTIKLQCEVQIDFGDDETEFETCSRGPQEYLEQTINTAPLNPDGYKAIVTKCGVL